MYKTVIILLCCTLVANLLLCAETKQKSNISNYPFLWITVKSTSTDEQVTFGVNEIKAAAWQAGIHESIPEKREQNSEILTIHIVADSLEMINEISKKGYQLPHYLGWQCYSLRTKKTDSNLEVCILSTDKTGAMYGCLDVAEAIRNNTIHDLHDSDQKPYLERRGIKFNIPLDLRTPSYSDHSDAFQQNIPEMWDLSFWKTQFDEMARHRYNVISLWNLNPFPSIVYVPEFPDITLNDVWRTAIKLQGESKQVRPYMNEKHEVIKKMTMNEKIAFWRKVMEYASERGIETYWFTWNIYPYGAEGKYGITGNQDNDTTIAYYRAAVRELVTTYPLLAGIGITAGENMNKDKVKGKYTDEQWLWKTYGEGVRDALRKQPQRKFRLIHRFHWTALSEINKEFKDYPGIVDFSIKYSVAHMYSITNPPFANGVFSVLGSQQRTWLTVRNDDIYSFRWGNPTYSREYIKNIPHPEKVAGFYMGSDGYCLGRDFLGKDSILPRPLLIQKQWYSYMLWGRLSYDPELPDELFRKTLETKFPGINSEILMKSWNAASMIFPWATRFSWGDIDVKWFPEACCSSSSYKGFYSVKTLLDINPMPGSHIRQVLDWAQNYQHNTPDSLMSPLSVADSLSKYAKIAMIGLNKLLPRIPGSSREIDLTLGDIEAFALIGNYYSEKFRGACSLALYNYYGLKQDKEEAVQHLTNAMNFWIEYAALYDSKTKPALYNRIGYVDVPALTGQVKNDIEIARNWEPGMIKEYKGSNTEKIFRE